MTVVVITPPEPLVSLALAKQHLRVDDDGQNTLIAAYIAAASAHIDGPDGWLGRAIGTQTLEMVGEAFPYGPLRLPYDPVQSVVSVKYLDANGVEQTWPSPGYEISGGNLLPVYGSSWPSVRFGAGAGAARVRWVAGRATIPPAIVAAVLLMVGDLFANRETSIEGSASAVPMSTTAQNLLSPFKAWRV